MKCKKGLSSGWHVVMYCIHPHYARKISSHATGDSISNREKQLFGTLTFKPPRRGKSPQTWETLESKQRQVFFALDDWKKPFISNSTTQSYIQKISNFPCIDPTLKSSMANEMPWKTKTGLRDLACLMANSENQDKVHAPWPSNPPSSVAAISEEIDPVEGRRRGYCAYLDWLSTSRATSIEISAVMYIALWKYVLSLAKKKQLSAISAEFWLSADTKVPIGRPPSPIRERGNIHGWTTVALASKRWAGPDFSSWTLLHLWDTPTFNYTEPEIKVCRTYLRRTQAGPGRRVKRDINKVHATTYKDFFSALVICRRKTSI